MMERLWNGILSRFGEDVILKNDEVDISVRALIQPCLEGTKEQELPGPLGLGRQERLRYMGPVRYPLDLDTVVIWKGREYRVQWAQMVGESVCPHCWAMLRPGEEAAL